MSDYEALNAQKPAPKVDFRGLAGDFFLMQLGNLALIIITLGIYRFWGKAKYRRYLWTQTTLDGDSLEYTGTGLELFIGAILVILLVSIPFGLLSLVMPMLIANKDIAIFVTQLILIGAIYYLVAVGQYRSWRYLFSRTSWRGIRSGMTEQGFAFGNFSFGLSLAQLFSLGLATPWVTTKRWNRLVRDVRIGNLPLEADADHRALWKPFLLVWGAVAVPAMVFIGWFVWRYGEIFKEGQQTPGDPMELLIAIGVLYLGIIVLGFVGAMLFANYQAHYLRETFNKTRIGGTMQVRIEVTTWEIIRYYLGNIALVIFTAYLGAVLLPYRYWAFMAKRIWIDGEYDEAGLEQSSLAAPGQGDGLVDAFDASSF
jgi:uncharacterized membrane protein YjgN (DUF898 family)